MGKAGGIIGLIGGIFAVFAALFTLFLGGAGAVFQAQGAQAIVAFGWYGLVSAFLVIVFGAVSIGKSNVGAFGLLLMSAVGAVLGGTAVAICLALSFLGGLLAASAKDAGADKRTWWQWLGLPLGIAVAVTISLQVSEPSKEAIKLPALTPEPVSVITAPAVPDAMPNLVTATASAPLPVENPSATASESLVSVSAPVTMQERVELAEKTPKTIVSSSPSGDGEGSPPTHEASGALLSAEQYAQISVMMLQRYRVGKVNRMLEDEANCWEDSARRPEVDRRIVATCISGAVVGGLIEATYARNQHRGVHPAYGGQTVRERIMANSRLSEDETKSIMNEVNVSAMLAALAGAGL